MHFIFIFLFLIFNSLSFADKIQIYGSDCFKLIPVDKIYNEQLQCFNGLEGSHHGFDPRPQCIVVLPHKINKNILAYDNKTGLHYLLSFKQPNVRALAKFFSEQNTILIAFNSQEILNLAYGHELHHYFLQKKYMLADPYHWHPTWSSCTTAAYNSDNHKYKKVK